MHHNITSAISLLLLSYFPDAAIGCWAPVPDTSTLSFVSTQAGAPLEGVFRMFNGSICLDPGKPGRIEVSVDVASVDTMLPELDEIIRGPDFFDSMQWPRAVFVSDRVEALGDDHYRVTGRLTLRNVTRTIEVPFDLTTHNRGLSGQLEGSTTIKRLDYGIGQGEWSDTRWVKDEVVLEFSVSLVKEE